MSDHSAKSLSHEIAKKFEYSIISLGILALILIFQPFSVTLFAIGSVLVVIAGLINNLLPLAQPGTGIRSLITVGMVVAMIFCIVLLTSIAAAHFYGVFFLAPPNPATMAGKLQLATPPFWMNLEVWLISIIALSLGVIIKWQNRRKH